MSTFTKDRSTHFKYHLEIYYKNMLSQAKEREQRRLELEATITSESAERQKKLWSHLESKESDYLRMKRIRLGVEDFTTLKVIGKGAFGEVFFYSMLFLYIL